MRPKSTRRIAAALGLAVIFTGLSAAPPAHAVPELRAPFGEAPLPTHVVAAWGQSILADVGEEYWLSTDNGQTWQPSALAYNEDSYLDSVNAGKATFVEDAGLAVLDLASNVKTAYASLPPEYEIWAANSEAAVAWDQVDDHPFVALPLTGGAPVELDEDYLVPPAYDEVSDPVYMFPGTALHLTEWYIDDQAVATDVNVMPLDGSQGLNPFRIKGQVAYVGISGDKVEWVKRVSTTVSLCSKPLVGGSETCRTITTLSSSRHSVLADRSGSVIRLELNGVEYLWEANALKKVTHAGSSAEFEGWGDTPRPLLRVSLEPIGGIYQVLAGGATAKLFDDLTTIPVWPEDLDLTADRLVGVDWREAAWTRSVGDAISTESLLPGRASEVKASAGRTVVNGPGGLSFYDQGALKSSTAAVKSVLDTSGPYVLTKVGTTNVLRTRTATVAATSPLAIFGSTYVGRGSDGKPFFRNLANPTNEAFADFASLPGTWERENTRIWGDYVAIEMEQPDGSTNIYVSDKRGAFTEHAFTGGELESMGDGVAVVYDDGDDDSDGAYVLWNFRTDTRTPIGAGEIEGPLTVNDAHLLAYPDSDGLVVTAVEGMGQSAPRLLGTVAAATFNPNAGPWTAEFDATKPLAAGTLEITHGTGVDLVVDRVLPVAAAEDGSIRGISWDGKNTAGEWLADGSYTWTLKTADSADPTKSLKAINGVDAASGTVLVKAANLGTVTAVTPKLSDTTPTVDQTIEALPGTWKPATTLFTYKWYRDTTLVKTGASASYLVTPADAGHTLKVNVTGSCPGTDTYCRGYATASKTSAVSAKVAKATITPAPVPTLNDAARVVDTPVTATIGTWGPGEIALSYQWYKVSSGGTSYAISKANSTEFIPTGPEVGYRLKLKVTGTRLGYTTKSVYSALTGKVASTTFTSVADPTITGSVKQGMPLTAVPGATDPAAKPAFQWYRGATAISGATAGTYKTTGSDLGKQLKVRVTYTRSGYASVVRFSGLTAPIEAGIVAVTPKLNDPTPAVGQELSVTGATGTSAWTPSDVTAAYQWYRDSTVVGTGATYVVQAADVGHLVKVKVTGSKDGFVPVSKTSAASAKVVKGVFTTKPQPTITGTAQVGQQLSAVSAGWAPEPTKFTYVWYRGGVAIPGQTQETYTLVAADTGKAITVKVTAVLAGFTSASSTSAPVGPVTPA